MISLLKNEPADNRTGLFLCRGRLLRQRPDVDTGNQVWCKGTDDGNEIIG